MGNHGKIIVPPDVDDDCDHDVVEQSTGYGTCSKCGDTSTPTACPRTLVPVPLDIARLLVREAGIASEGVCDEPIAAEIQIALAWMAEHYGIVFDERMRNDGLELATVIDMKARLDAAEPSERRLQRENTKLRDMAETLVEETALGEIESGIDYLDHNHGVSREVRAWMSNAKRIGDEYSKLVLEVEDV